MCTDRELKTLIDSYVSYHESIAKLDAIKKEIASEIIAEMETRKTDSFNGQKIITERLTENATKEGKAKLKELFSSDIDEYISVSYSKFINTKGAKKC